MAARTEKVYDAVIKSPQIDLVERIYRLGTPVHSRYLLIDDFAPASTMQLGPFAGPIYTIILVVDCLFFLFLEWWMPREDFDFVNVHWDHQRFSEVPFHALQGIPR